MDRKETTYKTLMTLTIVNVDISDFGTYNCLAKNSLGETDGAIKVYRKSILFKPHKQIGNT